MLTNWHLVNKLIESVGSKPEKRDLWLTYWNSGLRLENSHQYREMNGKRLVDKPDMSKYLYSWGHQCRVPSTGISLAATDTPMELNYLSTNYPEIILDQGGLNYRGSGLMSAYQLGKVSFGRRIDWRASKKPLQYYIKECSKLEGIKSKYHLLIEVSGKKKVLFNLPRNKFCHSLYSVSGRYEWKTHEIVELTNRWVPSYEVHALAFSALFTNEPWTDIIIEQSQYTENIKKVVRNLSIPAKVHVLPSNRVHSQFNTLSPFSKAILRGSGMTYGELSVLGLLPSNGLPEPVGSKILILCVNNKHLSYELSKLYSVNGNNVLPVTIYNIPKD